MGVKERLLEFISSEKIAVSEFERRAGLSNGYVSKERRAVSNDKVSHISEAFPNLNMKWVNTGEGEMLKYASDSNSSSENEVILVPILNLDARGGFSSNEELGTECKIGLMPFSRSIAKDGDFVIQIYGDSMSPKYESGSMVLVRRIEMWREYLEFGATYILELQDARRIIKNVHKGKDENSFKLVSINPTYEPSDIPKSMVSQVFRVLMSIQRESF